jgi:type I restriction enzyme S subunit
MAQSDRKRQEGIGVALTMGQSPQGNTYNDAGEGLPFFQGRTDFGFWPSPQKRIHL